MKRVIQALILLILATNALWAYFYVTKSNEQPAEEAFGVKLYRMQGSGSLWDINNYQVVLTPHQIQRGNGSLTYKGDPQEIEDSTYYELVFEEKNRNGEYIPVYSSRASSKGGPVGILNNLDQIGSITGDYDHHELTLNPSHIESTRLTINWADSKGEVHTETIQLSIDNQFTMN